MHRRGCSGDTVDRNIAVIGHRPFGVAIGASISRFVLTL